MIKARVYIGSSLLIGVALICGLDHVFGRNLGSFFSAMVALFVCLGLAEFCGLVEKKGCVPFRKVLVGSAAAYLFVRWLHLSGVLPQSLDVLAITAFIVLVFLTQGIVHKADNAIQNISCALRGTRLPITCSSHWISSFPNIWTVNFGTADPPFARCAKKAAEKDDSFSSLHHQCQKSAKNSNLLADSVFVGNSVVYAPMPPWLDMRHLLLG